MAIDNDAWFEILIRVDPYSIFNCILVCKPCLEVITSPDFRQTYQKKWNWKSNSKLVGFASHWDEFELSATSNLARVMIASMPEVPVEDYFICKSGEGDGLILYGSLSRERLFVSTADESPIPLPSPPVLFTEEAGTAILSRNDTYEVILAERNDDKLIIQSFSSSTGDWGVSEHNVDVWPSDSKFGDPGMVSSSRGLVYWRGERWGTWVAVYDANNRCISWIEPPNRRWVRINYGLSSQGYLRCAITGDCIEIWGYDDDDKENKVWNKFHFVDPNPIAFFVSFFPGECDSVVVKSGRRLFLYNLHTHKLESGGPLCTGKWNDDRGCGIDLVPLTMADLGVWPSSPFSDTTQTNISGVKQMLAFDSSGNI